MRMMLLFQVSDIHTLQLFNSFIADDSRLQAWTLLILEPFLSFSFRSECTGNLRMGSADLEDGGTRNTQKEQCAANSMCQGKEVSPSL